MHWFTLRFRAVLLPDLLGLFLFGVFFALPIFVLPRASNNTSLLDPEGGWIFLTLFFWLMALAGLADPRGGNVVLGLRVADAPRPPERDPSLRPDRVSIRGHGARRYPHPGAAARADRVRYPGQPVQLACHRPHPGRVTPIPRNCHRVQRAPSTASPAGATAKGWNALLAVLKQHRVPVDPEVEILLNE